MGSQVLILPGASLKSKKNGQPIGRPFFFVRLRCAKIGETRIQDYQEGITRECARSENSGEGERNKAYISITACATGRKSHLILAVE
jgi:hypothetical protein